ncbi:hypothetical protein KP509_02G060000 [Ceratopteris richardii]|uniref:Uncharacterized protein n=1 Tax=Ceratopteris richardii TaxID=49495 RepID=A0A8T2V6C9_CERRI|nr:hypothetical protein KP509_02G060000 [Ceratopteris richardii]
MWKSYYSSTSPTNVQLDESEVYGQPPHASVFQLGPSSTPHSILQKPKSLEPEPGHEKRYSDWQTSDIQDDSVGKDEDNGDTVDFLKWQRHQLEKDVFGLQGKLQEEVDLHYALKSAFGPMAGCLSEFSNLPAHAKKLVSEVAMLEIAISSLEEQIASLNFQLGFEQRERQIAEGAIVKLPFHGQEIQITEPICCQPFPKQTSCGISSYALPNAVQHPMLKTTSPCKSASVHQPLGNFTCPNKQGPLQDFCHAIDVDSQPDYLVQSTNTEYDHTCPHSRLFLAEKIIQAKDLKNTWHHPNLLSEEMVKCMVSIYRHLSNSMDGCSSSKIIASPTSPYGSITYSSVSSISESSSATASPSLALRSKDFGSEKSFDPYKLPEKIPWSDIGTYLHAVEVSEMSVGKEQLDYAAEALRRFRSLVEQLSQVDPASMKHNEKLAFWINVYNALMMHAYLAYGVPKNDFKFFSLMQKAAYTVGGHSFNAIVIEHLLLKAKAQWYRPQIALLLAHQKLKLREEVSTFAIDHVEPLVAFSLSFGARSSPAVRVYSAENIHEELQLALQDYARASVGLSTKGKLLIPKLLFDFGLDKVQEGNLVDWICQFLPCEQSNLIRNYMNHRQHKLHSSKYLSVVPFDFNFRYLFLLRCNL